MVIIRSQKLLKLLNLPAFFTLAEFSELIHVNANRLYLFSRFSYRYYRKFKIPKKSGKFRKIKQPSKNIKAIQAWILRNIIDKFQPSLYATAFQKGKGLIGNVNPHQNNRYYLIVDLEDFFPSISRHRIANIFTLMGYCKRAAKILSQLCTCDDSLPQGGITSPALSNLVAAQLDRRLAGYTSRRNIVYTRYADDLTFSSNNPEILNKAYSVIKRIIQNEHFVINNNKLRFLGPRRCCKITGLVKDSSKPLFGIGRKKEREMRAVMHSFTIKKIPDPRYPSEASINGWLAYVYSIDSTAHLRLLKYWKKLCA